MPETRRYNAEYYDAITLQTNDTEFYSQFVSDRTRLLELGCGTGRVSLALAKRAKRLVGVDLSDEMLLRAKAKDVDQAVQFVNGDITSIELGETFDLILAPFRVMQALETQAQVAGLFSVIRRHLDVGGTAILNVFRPFLSKEEMPLKWCREGESASDEVVLSNGDVLKTSDTRKHLDAKNQVLHPEIVHRRYRDGKLIDEHVNPICMRYYYPDEFAALIEKNGFKITGRWGGYDGQEYGQGPELVIAFQKA